MTLPSIPCNLSEWNLGVLDELTQLRDIESETFDFKSAVTGNNPVPSDLHNDICGMANTDGGFLVLGIGEVREGQKILGFRKDGFDKGNEDMVKRALAESRIRVEPMPQVEHKHIHDNDKFYTVVKVWSKEFDKPYFIRERAQCFVRVDSTTRPAARSTVVKLFSNMNKRVVDVETLNIAARLLRESFIHFVKEAGYADPAIINKITPIDLTFIRSAVISSEWFLTKNNSLGKVERNGEQRGVTTVIHQLERLNTYANAYNKEQSRDAKAALLSYLHEWKQGYHNFEALVAFLDKLCKTAGEFLEEYGHGRTSDHSTDSK